MNQSLSFLLVFFDERNTSNEKTKLSTSYFISFFLYFYLKKSLFTTSLSLFRFYLKAGNSRVSSLVRGIYLSLAPRLHLLEICTVLIRANLTVRGKRISSKTHSRQLTMTLFFSLQGACLMEFVERIRLIALRTPK